MVCLELTVKTGIGVAIKSTLPFLIRTSQKKPEHD